MNATPKTLHQAICNGLAQTYPEGSLIGQAHLAKKVEAHVLDFLRQKFGAAYLEHSDSVYSFPAIQKLAEEIGVASRSESAASAIVDRGGPVSDDVPFERRRNPRSKS